MGEFAQLNALQSHTHHEKQGVLQCLFALDIDYYTLNSSKFMHDKHCNPIFHKYRQQSPKNYPRNTQRGDASLFS